MGIEQTKMCGTQPQIQSLLVEATQTTKAFADFKLPVQIERVTSKPIFHRISPVQNHNAQVESQVQSDTQSQQAGSIQPSIVLNSQSQINLQLQGNSLISLEQILFEAQQKIERNRIGVHWNSFVRIKKKNYLQDYTFVKELGKGAYGSVLKVRMKYGGLLRAAKVIKSSLVRKNKEKRGKLFAEILIPIRLDHPNLVKLYEVFQYNEQYVLIMQLCEGGDLFQNIRKSRYFSESKAGHLIRQILSAVNYMHKKKVIHRDLKPQNILIEHESNGLKIADFGTATIKNSKKLTQKIGTSYYIAPQVITGSYDEKCDIWSCGIILYVMLSGSPPFNGKNQKQIIDSVICNPVQFKNPIWEKRNKKAIELVRLMLNKNPLLRISAQEALKSEWLSNLTNRGSQTANQIEWEVINNLRTFHFENRLKAVVYTFIASQLYTNQDKQNLLRIFREIDKNCDGVIERQQLLLVFNKHSGSQLSQVEIQKILLFVDTNNSGQIDFTQFLVAASNQQKLLSQRRLENAFDYLDSDHSGFISVEQIKNFLDKSEESNEQIKRIFNEVDVNGDGEISKKEFVSLLMKTR